MAKVKKTASKIIRIFLCLILAGFLAVTGINLYMISYANRFILSQEEASSLSDIDCIMVLGCGVYKNEPTPLLADRLDRGIALFQAKAAPKLLMSGDHGQSTYDEVNVMKSYAMAQNIEESAIFMDHAGFSTYESMYRAKDVFGVKKMIIVTQKYHLSRAVYIADKLGIEAYGVASDYRQFGGQIYRDGREVLARVKDVFTVVFLPKPTYLGESIPISGSGLLTNG